MSFPVPACAVVAGEPGRGGGGLRCPPWVPPVPLPLCGARDTSLRGGASGGHGRPGGVTTTGRSWAASEVGGWVNGGVRGRLRPFHPPSWRGKRWTTPCSGGVWDENKVSGRQRRGARCGWEPAATRLSGDCAPHRRCYGPGPPPPAAPRGLGEDARQILPPSHHAWGWPLLPPPSPSSGGAGGAGRAGRGSCWAEPGRAALGRGARRAEMLQLFFSAEEGGRWIELCHVADKFPLASSPCTSPPPPLRTHAGLFFFFFPLLFLFF